MPCPRGSSSAASGSFDSSASGLIVQLDEPPPSVFGAYVDGEIQLDQHRAALVLPYRYHSSTRLFWDVRLQRRADHISGHPMLSWAA